MDIIPVWALFLGTIFLIMLAIELGYRCGLAAHRRSEDEKESPVSAIAGSILGLSAFMLAFAFGIVADRYDTKRSLVREDANAIRTVYQRADFLPEPDRAEAKKLLKEYINGRVSLATEGVNAPELVQTVLTDTKRIQDRLWDMAVVNARKDMNSDVAAMYIDALNEMNSVHATRVSIGIQARMPLEIWGVLYFITILGMVGLGYQTGIAASNRSMARPFLALSFSLVFALIAVLDRTDSGYMKVSQRPLIDLLESITDTKISAPTKGK